MSNINVENKYPKGAQDEESLVAASVTGYTRGLAVVYGADLFHAALVTAAATRALGIIEEDQVVPANATVPVVPMKIIQFGQTVAQIGAAVTLFQMLTTNASAQLVPAGPGQPVVAIALDANPNAGDYVCVFVCAPLGIYVPGTPTTHYVAAGALPILPESCAGLGSAGALAMTLAQPTAAQDGSEIFITAETSHAHTVTCAANGINGSKHLITFANQGDGVWLNAVNTVWNVSGLVGGTVVG
jgi:hypothetical protein